MRECFERAAAAHRLTLDGHEHVGRCEVRVQRNYERLHLREDARIVRLVEAAAQRLGRPFRTRATGGGSDANVFTGRGLEVANLACGMRDIHTVNEWVDVKDLMATAEHLVELLRVNAEQPA
jgi:tripeptide aminopeptidase